MIRTQNAALHLQGLPQKRLSLGVFALNPGNFSKAAHGFQGLRILWPQQTAAQVQGSLQLLPRLRVEPQVHVRLPYRVPNGCLHLRLPVELSRNVLRRPVERCPHLQVWIRFGAGPRLGGGARLRQHIILKKIGDRLRRGRFPVGAQALPDTDNRCHEKHQNEGAGSH